MTGMEMSKVYSMFSLAVVSNENSSPVSDLISDKLNLAYSFTDSYSILGVLNTIIAPVESLCNILSSVSYGLDTSNLILSLRVIKLLFLSNSEIFIT